MAEVNGELIYEVLKQIQQDLAALKEGQREHTAALNALRTHVLALQQDQANIYSILVRHESRLDRIERRLNIAEAPA
jgi:septal ring factor EnvC (AmiA/AmiB activator)